MIVGELLPYLSVSLFVNKAAGDVLVKICRSYTVTPTGKPFQSHVFLNCPKKDETVIELVSSKLYGLMIASMLLVYLAVPATICLL